MPAPATDQTNFRRSVMTFRVAPAERQQLEALVAAQGTTLSELIRRGLQSQGFVPQR